ncbi:MAG: DNA polymerase III subunit delta [Sandarakinorhabdus sp.]|jgi:DNA polymerase-3 subunit delta|nr:DNA polymerase III subunit delta [Sandarakinorhabdus sp.]
MKIDAARAAGFAKAWPPDVRLLLLHGPDESASRDIARQIAAAQAAAGVGVTDLIGATLKDDPQALVAAVTSLSMFGDRELLRLDGLDDDGLEAIEALLAAPQGHAVLAVAGSLKKGSKLLALAEREPAIAACINYEATQRDAPRLLADMAAPLGLRLDQEVAESLFESADGDRMVLRAELEKFALYKNAQPGAPQRLTLDDLAALGIVSGEAELFAPIGAITIGDVESAVELVGRLPDGVAIPLLRALERRFATLAQMRADVDAGKTPAAVVDAAGRAIFFREKPFYIKALSAWTQNGLAGALADVLAAERAIKAGGGTADLGVQSLLLGLARRAAAAQQRQR